MWSVDDTCDTLTRVTRVTRVTGVTGVTGVTRVLCMFPEMCFIDVSEVFLLVVFFRFSNPPERCLQLQLAS